MTSEEHAARDALVQAEAALRYQLNRYRQDRNAIIRCEHAVYAAQKRLSELQLKRPAFTTFE